MPVWTSGSLGRGGVRSCVISNEPAAGDAPAAEAQTSERAAATTDSAPRFELDP